jgi:hypothetical protein
MNAIFPARWILGDPHPRAMTWMGVFHKAIIPQIRRDETDARARRLYGIDP